MLNSCACAIGEDVSGSLSAQCQSADPGLFFVVYIKGRCWTRGESSGFTCRSEPNSCLHHVPDLFPCKLAVTQEKARRNPSVWVSTHFCCLFPFYSYEQLIHTLLLVTSSWKLMVGLWGSEIHACMCLLFEFLPVATEGFPSLFFTLKEKFLQMNILTRVPPKK